MKISNIFLRRSAATIIGMFALHSASSYAARCEYVIQSEWGSGFVAAVRITNDTSTAINGWSVSCNYTDGTTRTGGWNANISGSNPYTATGVGWNDNINPGQTIEFGLQGNKGAAGNPAQRPQVTGAVCNGSTSSEASSSVESSASSSVESSSPVESSSSSSEIIISSSSIASSSDESSSAIFSSASSSERSSSSTSSISSEGPIDNHPLDNPFTGARWYVDPVWSGKARAEIGGDKVARFNTAVWMDRIGAIDPADGFGLRDHLDAALEQNANLIQIVVYDLPNRDCHALASNGELTQGPEGTLRYRTEYIDVIAEIFSDSKYRNLRIVAIIEPDSLPNLVTNLSDEDCQLATDATDGYVANTRYTLSKLSQIPNVYSYVDIGHSGWLGWDDNFGEAITLIGDAIKGSTAGVNSIAGFVSNTAGYTPTHEPFLDSLANSAFPGSGGGTQTRQASFYEWNPYFSEVAFVQAWRTRMIAAGFPSSIGMLVDTSRNGWGGAERPTAQSGSTVLDTFVNESRVDRRIHRGNWCNQPGGIGERPQATPAAGVDAYVWVKPPGESDGASSLELSHDPLDPAKGFDRMCDPTYGRSEGNNGNVGTGSLANAPVAGRWFPEAFQLLVQNAYPALDDVPPSSSSSASSTPVSSSSIATSSTGSSSVTFSSEASSSSTPIISSSSSSVRSSSSTSGISSEGPIDNHPLDNPFTGARWYVDPVWSGKARAEIGGDKVARFNTAVWMDRIGAIDPADGFGLRDHLDAALEQNANLIQIVVYDLPNRDCHALASNGELTQGPEGTLRYRTEYIDVIAEIFSDSKYRNLRIVAIIEPDSLPNLVTNLSDEDCQLATDATDGYVANTRYTLSKLSQIPNVYSYVDIGHSGWLGWDDNFGEAITLIGDAIKGSTAGVNSIAGFVSNTAGYTPTHEPFLDSLANSAFPGSGGGTQTRQASFYEWNPYFSEVAFVQAWRTRMIAAGFPSSIGMLVDTSRNGWGGAERPTAQSGSTVLDTFVNESRVDRRIHRGNWCNQPGGIGERPQAAPAAGVDAYVWVKPPGESDGASSLELSHDPLDPAKGFDRMCDPTYGRSEGNNGNVGTGSLANAPVAGRWFPEAFQLLVQNAYPALDDVPPSSSSSASSTPASSSSIAFSSEDSSSEQSSSETPSSVASSAEESSSSIASSEISSSESSSEQSSSSNGNQAPVANLTVTTTGSTIHINGRASVDAEGDELTYLVDFGDGSSIEYPEAWHTYSASGSYTVTLTVSDGTNTTSASETIEAEATSGNQAPIARFSAARSGLNIVAFGSTSFDADGDEISYLWDFGSGDAPGDSTQVFNDCEAETSVAAPRLITLTVFDGELADTQQVSFDQPCGVFEQKTTTAEFTWRVQDNTLYVDGRGSIDAVYLAWDFGDGGNASGLINSHTYTEPGTYSVTLTAYGPDLPDTHTIEITVGETASSSSSSSTESLSSSIESSSSSSLASSSASSSVITEPNTYLAPRAQTAPEIDGTIDAVWDQASWTPINVFWLGTQSNPSAEDYTGQYKALWDENYLYLLFDITDERLYDNTRSALDAYWEDDTVEIFIDENKNGGQHQYNASAWAYHISTYGDVVDYTTSGPKLLNDHIDVRLVSLGDKHLWEMRVRIYGEDYSDSQANTPLTLTANKELGFSASYIDNDGGQQRESMMGSVDTEGHRNNQGYIDASVFGTLKLVE